MNPAVKPDTGLKSFRRKAKNPPAVFLGVSGSLSDIGGVVLEVLRIRQEKMKGLYKFIFFLGIYKAF